MKNILTLLSILITIISCSKLPEDKNIFISEITPDSAGQGEVVIIKGGGFDNLVDSGGVVTLQAGDYFLLGTIINNSTIEFIAGGQPYTSIICILQSSANICSPHPFTMLPGDPEPNVFTRLPDYPGTVDAAYMFAINNTIYAGWKEMYKFDTKTRLWAKVSSNSLMAFSPNTFSFAGKGYVFGGLTNAEGNGSARMQEYDPTTNSWKEKSSLPGSKRSACASFVFNSKFYVAGGEAAYGDPPCERELWEYDPLKDEWKRKADLPSPFPYISQFHRFGNKFILPAGFGCNGYDATTDTWTLVNAGLEPFCGVFSSNKEDNVSYVINGTNNSVFRNKYIEYNNSITVSTYNFNIPINSKKIVHQVQVGKELFFFTLVEGQNLIDEFWSYLPE